MDPSSSSTTTTTTQTTLSLSKAFDQLEQRHKIKALELAKEAVDRRHDRKVFLRDAIASGVGKVLKADTGATFIYVGVYPDVPNCHAHLTGECADDELKGLAAEICKEEGLQFSFGFMKAGRGRGIEYDHFVFSRSPKPAAQAQPDARRAARKKEIETALDDALSKSSAHNAAHLTLMPDSTQDMAQFRQEIQSVALEIAQERNMLVAHSDVSGVFGTSQWSSLVFWRRS